MSDIETSVKNFENQFDRSGYYSRGNCILIHGITETQDENIDDVWAHTERAR